MRHTRINFVKGTLGTQGPASGLQTTGALAGPSPARVNYIATSQHEVTKKVIDHKDRVTQGLHLHIILLHAFCAAGISVLKISLHVFAQQ